MTGEKTLEVFFYTMRARARGSPRLPSSPIRASPQWVVLCSVSISRIFLVCPSLAKIERYTSGCHKRKKVLSFSFRVSCPCGLTFLLTVFFFGRRRRRRRRKGGATMEEEAASSSCLGVSRKQKLRFFFAQATIPHIWRICPDLTCPKGQEDTQRVEVFSLDLCA